MKTSDTVLIKNIPFTLFERFVCERELESEQNCNILTPQPLRTQPCVVLVLLDCSTGGLGGIFSPTGLQTNWLPVFTELYNSSIAHSISLEWHVWLSSSGNNCHAVHRSLSSGASVYDCSMGFYLVPYCQPSPPTGFLPISAIGMCHFLPVHHFGMACLAGSKVNIQQYELESITLSCRLPVLLGIGEKISFAVYR